MAWEENSRICLHMQLIAILSRTGVIKDRWSFEKQKPRFSFSFRETRFHYHCYIGNNPKSSASI